MDAKGQRECGRTEKSVEAMERVCEACEGCVMVWKAGDRCWKQVDRVGG